MGRLSIIIGLFFLFFALTSNYLDILLHLSGKNGVTKIGQLWYDFFPESLQIFEVLISRYIDPCSIFAFLGCSGFLWHPTISTLLNLPAGITLALISFILIGVGFKKRRKFGNYRR